MEKSKIIFPDEFFLPETRDDFFIDGTMKRYWACCMDIIDVIDSVCKRHNLKYYADWGTLLGAIRHNGYIPWDDDIDIALIRPEYEMLMKYLPIEMPKEYWLSTPFTNTEHRSFSSGLSNGKEINLDKEFLNKRHQCPFVATIDIYPLDYLPRDKQEAETVKSIFYLIWYTIHMTEHGATDSEIKESVCKIEELLDISINKNGNLRNELWKLANQLVMSYNDNDGDYLVFWCEYINKGYKLEKRWYDKVVYVPFENIKIPVPHEYEKILTALYGDWKTPIRGGQSHDYPCYRKQLDFLRRIASELKNN